MTAATRADSPEVDDASEAVAELDVEKMISYLKLGADLHDAAISAGIADVDDMLDADAELRARVRQIQAQIKVNELAKLRQAASAGDRDAQKRLREFILAKGGTRKSTATRHLPDAQVRNEGQRLLMAVPASLRDIAAKSKTTRQAVSMWRRGEKLPSASVRAALEAAYAIPFDAWDLGAELYQATGEQTTRSEPPRNDARRSIEWVNENLEIVGTELRRRLVPVAKARFLDQQLKWLKYRDELRREEELREARYLQHPRYLAMKQRLAEALAPFPDAARAAAEAMRELNHDDDD